MMVKIIIKTTRGCNNEDKKTRWIDRDNKKNETMEIEMTTMT